MSLPMLRVTLPWTASPNLRQPKKPMDPNRTVMMIIAVLSTPGQLRSLRGLRMEFSMGRIWRMIQRLGWIWIYRGYQLCKPGYWCLSVTKPLIASRLERVNKSKHILTNLLIFVSQLEHCMPNIYTAKKFSYLFMQVFL